MSDLLSRLASLFKPTVGGSLLPPGLRVSRVLLVTLAAFAAAGTCFGEEPRVTAVRLDGSKLTGRLAEFGEDAFRIANEQEAGKNLDLRLAEVLSLQFEAQAEAAVALPVLEFANGDRIRAEIVETSDDHLNVRWHDAVLRVPIEVLRGVIFRRHDVNDGSIELLLRDRGPNDIVLLSNGDRLAGQFLNLGGSDLKIDVEGREVLAPRERIAAIFFSPELTIAADIAGLRQIVHDGTGWLTVEGLARQRSGLWTGTTAFAERVSWPADSVRRVETLGERVVALSSLDPQIEFTPYLERRWPVRVGRTVTGEPLSIGEQLYATGVGVHSRCRLRYHLAKQFESFHAIAGVATSGGQLGSVEFAVECDGDEVLRTGPIERSSQPVRITNLDVRSVETMILTVDYGRNGDILDRANWCDAVLVRKPAASE